jgi:hypothetical protein
MTHGEEWHMTDGKQPAADVDLVRLVTIGVPLGTAINPDTKAKEGMLRQGRELLTFDSDAYKVLYLAGGPAIRAEVIEDAAKFEVADPESVIERCMEAGLLREIDFHARTPDDRWRDLRLVPVGLGLGIDENNVCRIDAPSRGTVEVERFAYSLWSASDGRSIQDVVDSLAESVGPARLALSAYYEVAGSVQELDDMAQVLVAKPELAAGYAGQAIPGSVMALMLRGAAYLDRVP